MFDLLLGVSGVGPKSALGVLVDAQRPTQVAEAVAADDDAPFRRVSGIGPKTAKLIVGVARRQARRAASTARPRPAPRRGVDRAGRRRRSSASAGPSASRREAVDDAVGERDRRRARTPCRRCCGSRSPRSARAARRSDAGAMSSTTTTDSSSPARVEAELAFEGALRPRRLAEFVGQQKVRGQLQLLLDAAAHPAAHARPHPARRSARARQDDARDDRRARERPAAAACRAARRSSTPATSPRCCRASCPARCCSSTRSTAWRARAEEMLYLAMEDFRIDIMVGKGAGRHQHPARPRRRSRSSARRRGRGCCPTRCATGSASPRTSSSTTTASSSRCSRAPPRMLGLDDRRPAPAPRSRAARRGTPRIANRLLRRVRDYALVHGGGERRTRRRAMPRSSCTTSIRSASTGSTARCWMRSSRRFDGGPVGLNTLAVVGRRGAETIESVVEPFLVRIGLHEPHAARPGRHPAGLGAPRASRASEPAGRSSTMTYDSGLKALSRIPSLQGRRRHDVSA